MIEALDDDDDMVVVKRSVARLAEHFDNVQIMVTRMNGRNTVQICSGEGNYSARFGLVREWLLKEESKMREDEDDDD